VSRIRNTWAATASAGFLLAGILGVAAHLWWALGYVLVAPYWALQVTKPPPPSVRSRWHVRRHGSEPMQTHRMNRRDRRALWAVLILLGIAITLSDLANAIPGLNGPLSSYLAPFVGVLCVPLLWQTFRE
jgi:hypothetical protein